MKSLFRKMHKGEKGFTLVELLVVFSLLAILAAIMIPSVASLVNFGDDTAEAAELSIIQTAVDSMMAVNSLGTGECPEVATSTADMANFPSAVYPLYPDYVRYSTTSENYTVDADGLVAQVAIP